MLGLDAVIWIQILPAFSNNLNAEKYLPFEFTFDYRKSMGIHITQTNTLQWKSSHAKEDQKRTQIEMLIMGFKGKPFQLIFWYLLMYWIKILSWKTTEFQMLVIKLRKYSNCDQIFGFIMIWFQKYNSIYLLLLSF